MSSPRLTSPRKRRRFLANLAKGVSITASCKAAGISAVTAYQWRKDNPTFAQQWDDAIDSGTDLLEDIAYQRAISKSDLLMMFMLKGRRPDKFRDNVRVQVERIESEIERELARLATPAPYQLLSSEALPQDGLQEPAVDQNATLHDDSDADHTIDAVLSPS